LNENSILGRISRLFRNFFSPKKQVPGLSLAVCRTGPAVRRTGPAVRRTGPAVRRTGKPFLDAKISLAKNSARPCYIKVRERFPVTAAKGHQLARTGRLHGVPKYPERDSA